MEPDGLGGRAGCIGLGCIIDGQGGRRAGRMRGDAVGVEEAKMTRVRPEAVWGVTRRRIVSLLLMNLSMKLGFAGVGFFWASVDGIQTNAYPRGWTEYSFTQYLYSIFVIQDVEYQLLRHIHY